MAIIRKFSPKENLNFFSTFITDTDPNSTYFRISEFKEEYTGGKNGFTIEGSEFLKETTELKIEILDVNGNTIYFEPGQGIPEYYEGLSKVVSVHVYDDTPIGIAEITILGELKNYQRDDGSVVEVPDVWKGVYNVKWKKQFKVNKLLSNEDKVRFFKRPTIQIDEINKPILTTISETITQLGTVVGTPNVPIAGNSLRNFTQPTSYRIDSVGGAAWTGSIVGTQLQIPTLNYFPTVIDIIDTDTLIVQEPYTVNNIVQPFTATGYTASFSDTTNFVEGSILTGSFSKIKISNLKTFVGDVARVKVFRKSQSTAESFQLTQEIQLESNELLVDLDVIDRPEEFYGLLTEPVLAEYWETSSNDLQTSFTQEYLYNAVVLNGTTTPHLFYVNRELDIQTDVEYTLSFGIRLKGTPLASNYIQPFISGSRTVIVDGTPITTQVRQNITKIPGLSRYLEKNKIEANFISEDIDNAQLYFEVVGGEWYLNEISLRASQESSFSPDEITFIQIVPRTLPVETFDFRFEFYDINNNYIPIRVTAQKTFSGGNLQQLNRSLRVTPTNLFFVYDNNGNSVGVNNIIFNIEKTLLTGSVLFTSGAFDSGGLLIPSESYAGQYPGLLTNITETSATLTSANFTGSDSTVDVSFIEYNASCEDLTTTFTIGKLIDGESAKAVLVNADHNQFFYKRSTLAPTTPQTILIRANKLNIPPTSTFSIISSSNIPLSLQSGFGTSTEIYSISTNTFGYLNGPVEYVFTAEDEFGNSFSDSVVIETVVDGAAATLKLSRDNHTYVAKSTGELLSSITDGNVDIDLFVGSDQIDYVNENPITTNNRWSIIGVNAEGVTPTSVTIVDGNTARIGITSFDSNLIDSGSVFITASYRDGAGVSESISRKITYNKTKKAAPVLQLQITNNNQSTNAKSTGEQLTPFETSSLSVIESYDGITVAKTLNSAPTVTATGGYTGFNVNSTRITYPINLSNALNTTELTVSGQVTDIEGSVRPVSGSISLTKNKNAAPSVLVTASPQVQSVVANADGVQIGILSDVVVSATEGGINRLTSISIISSTGFDQQPVVINTNVVQLSNKEVVENSIQASVIVGVNYTNSEGVNGSENILINVSKVTDGPVGTALNVLVEPPIQIVNRTLGGQFGEPIEFDVRVFDGSTEYGYTSSTLTGNDFTITNLVSASQPNSNQAVFKPDTPTTILGTVVTFDVNISGSDDTETTVPKSHRVSVTLEGQTGPGIVFTGVWEPDRLYQFSDGADSPGTARRDAVLWSTGGLAPYDAYYATLRGHVSDTTTNQLGNGAPNFTTGSTWQFLGTQDFFVAAKIGIFEESFVQNTLNVGSNNNGGISSANITLAGGTNNPYISIGQNAEQDYGLPGIFIGSGSAAKLSLSGSQGALKWDGSDLDVTGSLNVTGNSKISGTLSVSQGTVGFSNEGIFLGVDGGVAKFSVSGSQGALKWNGSDLDVTGSLDVTGNSKISGTVSVSQETVGFSQPGIFLGVEGNVAKFSVSGSQGALKWNGNNLDVTGSLSVTGISKLRSILEIGDGESGYITINQPTDGFSQPGIFLGVEGNDAKFSVSGSQGSLKWNGASLDITGSLDVTGNSKISGTVTVGTASTVKIGPDSTPDPISAPAASTRNGSFGLVEFTLGETPPLINDGTQFTNPTNGTNIFIQFNPSSPKASINFQQIGNNIVATVTKNQFISIEGSIIVRPSISTGLVPEPYTSVSISGEIEVALFNGSTLVASTKKGFSNPPNETGTVQYELYYTEPNGGNITYSIRAKYTIFGGSVVRSGQMPTDNNINQFGFNGGTDINADFKLFPPPNMAITNTGIFVDYGDGVRSLLDLALIGGSGTTVVGGGGGGGGTVTSVASGTQISGFGLTITNPTSTPTISTSITDAGNFRTAIGAGTVTSVGGTGTVSGLTLSGTVTTSGNLTLGGTLSVVGSNFGSQTANTFLAAPNGSPGNPTFRAIVASDVPTLNQNTTGTAANVTGTVAVANGGTGQTTYTNGQLLIGNGNTLTKNTLTAGTGITVTNGTGTITIGLTGQALALHNLATNGIIVRTDSGTIAARTITGTTNQVTVTNGDGIIDNPTLSLPQNIHNAATPTFGGLTVNGNIGIRAAASLALTTQIPVFTADPASTTRTIVTRTPAELRGDIGAGTVVSVSAGSGMNFTTITTDGSITLGTPSTLTISTTNGLTTNSHTHQLDLSGRTLTAGDGLTGGGNLGSNLSFAVNSTVVRTTGDQDISGVKTFTTAIRITGTSKAAGRFYAGTTNPDNTTRLNYDGHFHITQATANNFILSSDRRLKSDIIELNGGLDLVSKLKPMEYIKSENKEFGFITDEIPEELDFLVKRSGEYEALDYISMIGILVKSVQELKGELDTIKKNMK